MSDDAVFRDCIEATLREIGTTLATAGFPAQPLVISASTDKLYRWVRRSRWKGETVQASHKRKTPRSLVLSLVVEIPCRDGEDVILDGRSVEAILKRRGDIGWLPQVFTRARCAGYSKDMVGVVQRALPWFEHFRAPGDALRRLRSGETNHGLVRSKAFEQIESFLEGESATLSGAPADASGGEA